MSPLKFLYYRFLNLWREGRPVLVGVGFYGFLASAGFYTIVYNNTGEGAIKVHIPVRLPSAQNLKIGAPVFVLGVPSGYVESFHYVTLDRHGKPFPLNEDLRRMGPGDISGQFILASLALNRKVNLAPDARVFARFQNVLSEKSLEIDPGKMNDGEEDRFFRFTGDERETLETRGEFPKDFDPSLLVDARNFDDPLYLIASLLSENRKGLRRITLNLAEATEKINRGEGDLSRALNRPDLYDGSVALVEETIILVSEARDGLESYRETDAMIDFLGGWVPTLLWRQISGR